MNLVQQSWQNSDTKIQEILSSRLNSGNDDSFYVFNVKDVERKLQFWTEKFPRVKPFFAMKSNHSDIAIQTMARLGTGFDCASRTEIRRILELGVDSEKIIYANPAKQFSFIKYVRENRVHKMTFDNIDELIKIKSIFPSAQLVMRIRFDAEKAVMSFGEKFGCDPKLEAPDLIKSCKEMGLNLIGISFHAGNELQDHKVFRDAIRTIKKLFGFAETIGFKLNFVDIGGGFLGDDMVQVEHCAKFINAAIDECFPDSSSVDIIAEPGLFFMQTSMKLLCNVHSKRVQRDADGKIVLINYFLNNGVFSSFLRNFLFNIQLIPRLFQTSASNQSSVKHETIFWGPTCDSSDKIFQLSYQELQVGDWIIFDDNVGAYGLTRCTEFNGFEKPEVVPLH